LTASASFPSRKTLVPKRESRTGVSGKAVVNGDSTVNGEPLRIQDEIRREALIVAPEALFELRNLPIIIAAERE
jgi:hypothetical protein